MGDRFAAIDKGSGSGMQAALHASVNCETYLGVMVPLSVGEARSPSNAVSPGPMPTSVRSGILIVSYRIRKKAVDNTQRFALDYINAQENAASRHSIKSI